MCDEPSTVEPEATDSETADANMLNNPQVFALVMSAIDERVAARTRERNESLRNWLIGLLTMGVVLITAGGGLAFQYFAEKAVLEAVNTFRFDSAIASLNVRVLRLDMADSFSTEEADSIINEIDDLYSEQPEVPRRNKLVFAVETAVESFAAAGNESLVNRLENVAPDVFHRSNVIAPLMVQLLGLTLLSDSGAPRTWTDQEGMLKEKYASYQEYAARAKDIGYPELYLAYEMLLQYMAGRETEEIKNLIADSDDLDGPDGTGFINVMTSLALNQVQSEPNEASTRAARTVGNFLCEYADEGDLLTQVSTFVDREC